MKHLQQQKTWDPVTRLWHWVLVLSVCVGWGLGRYMDFDTIEWHFYLGYTTGILLLLRCWRGFFGPDNIRFKALLPTPKQTIDYIKTMPARKPSGSRGHNPVGSLSVLAMIILIGVQASSGLFVESDDFFESGPMAVYASEGLIRTMTWLHHLFADFILVIVALHVGAILFYLIWKKENLIKPMINGWKWVKQK